MEVTSKQFEGWNADQFPAFNPGKEMITNPLPASPLFLKKMIFKSFPVLGGIHPWSFFIAPEKLQRKGLSSSTPFSGASC